MNVFELQNQLRIDCIRSDCYNLCGTNSTFKEGVSLENDNGLWKIFFIERGKKTLQNECADENDACQKMIGILKNMPGANMFFRSKWPLP